MDNIKAILAIIITCIIYCNGEFNIIELNYDLGPETPHFPILVNGTFKIKQPFRSVVQEAGYSRGFWLAYSEITFQTHMSTFVTAPYTLINNTRTIDQIPFRNLFSTAAVIDVRDKVRQNNTYLVTVEDVQDWVKENGMFPKHCIVLFNTGWDVGRYPNQLKYFGSNDFSNMKFPGVLPETLNYILEFERTHGIYFVGFGTDTPTVHPQLPLVVDPIFKNDKYSINTLRDLKRLPPKGARIMVMPLKIKNGEGAPARVAAKLPYY
ncbi:UNVERIFIED_CONTAM: hypothetical protein RMT77_011376 [Armadillidium vulgare]